MEGVISPTSSKNSVPPSAASKSPALRSMAPVYAPFSWPKSSLASRSSLKAPQLTARKRLPARWLAWWMARATSSLPVPVSPSSSTVEEVGATWAMVMSRLAMAGLLPTRSGGASRSLRRWRRSSTSRRRRLDSTALAVSARTSSRLSGLAR